MRTGKAAFLLAMILHLGAAMASAPLRLEGVSIPPTLALGDQTLRLNGAGVRTVMLFVVPVKAYVASLHSTIPLRTPPEAMDSREPMEFTFNFLRGVGVSQVRQAWLAQIQSSATHSYTGFAHDRDLFVSLFGAIAPRGTQSVRLANDETVIFENGRELGRIPGRDFQKAFLSLWFGTRPVSAELKTALLNPSAKQ